MSMAVLFDPSLPLELLNGLSMILSAVFEGLMVLYLIKESRRRNLGLRDWFFRLPPSMHLGVAITIYVAGVFLRTGTAWAWRRFYHAGPFTLELLSLLTVSAALIALGAICKIKAISKPDWGDGPWMISVAIVIAFVIADLYFR